MLHAGLSGEAAGIVSQIVATEGLEQVRDLGVVDGGNQNAVRRRGIQVVGRQTGLGAVAVAARHMAAVGVVHDLRRHEVQGAVQQRSVDELTLAGGRAPQQSREDGGCRHQTSVHVDGHDTEPGGIAVRQAIDGHDAGVGLQGAVISGEPRLGPGLAITADGAPDQSRIALAAIVGIEAQPGHHAGPEIVHHDIGPVDQLAG